MTKIDTKPVTIPFQSKQALIDDQIRSIQANVSSSCFLIYYFTQNLLFKKFRRLYYQRFRFNLGFVSTVVLLF